MGVHVLYTWCTRGVHVGVHVVYTWAPGVTRGVHVGCTCDKRGVHVGYTWGYTCNVVYTWVTSEGTRGVHVVYTWVAKVRCSTDKLKILPSSFTYYHLPSIKPIEYPI